jgi:hypothetical protein
MFGILVVLSADVDSLFGAKLEQSSADCSSQYIFYCLAGITSDTEVGPNEYRIFDLA